MSNTAPDAKPGLGVILGGCDVIVTAIVLLVGVKECTGFVQWWTCTYTRFTSGYAWLYLVMRDFNSTLVYFVTSI